MKIIDLLNKIANGEEVPKKIIWNKLVYDYKDGLYYDYCGETLIGSLNFDGTNLHDEVEIIEEEKKIPEKIDLAWQNAFDEQVQQDCIKMILENINIILDYLKSKGE